MVDGNNAESFSVRLLLVDNEEGFIDVLAKRIGKRNIQVRKAYSGFEALQILQNEQFDVALLDLKLPDMDGIEVLKIFRKIAPDLQVIMLTGHGSDMEAKESLAYGAVDYLIKPFSFEEMIEKIRHAVPRRR